MQVQKSGNITLFQIFFFFTFSIENNLFITRVLDLDNNYIVLGLNTVLMVF